MEIKSRELMVAGCRLWLPVVNLFGRFTSDSIFAASDLAFLALFILLSGPVSPLPRTTLALGDVVVVCLIFLLGIVDGRGKCLAVQNVLWHKVISFVEIIGNQLSGDVKGNLGIRGNEENLTFPRTNVDG
ncbi:hypothetical protein F2Q69_00050247 [Brassica cretica]|uniref:Uncharacterized protein n=1 Tax=Brassica cretica TaxID=69181 RepID=A0A8S9PN33_BRACR|nr:hypothetical protein F2Q69_00050247 [Brassica cretica]